MTGLSICVSKKAIAAKKWCNLSVIKIQVKLESKLARQYSSRRSTFF